MTDKIFPVTGAPFWETPALPSPRLEVLETPLDPWTLCWDLDVFHFQLSQYDG